VMIVGLALSNSNVLIRPGPDAKQPTIVP